MYQWLRGLVSGIALTLTQFLLPTTSTGLISTETLNWIEGLRSRYDIPGISIGIVVSPEWTKDGWRNQTYGLGYMNTEGQAVDGDTMFEIGSNTKLFTAVSIGLLVDAGTLLENGEKLEYSTKVKDILPDWKLQDSYMTEHLDISDLLSMRSGMPRHDGSYTEENPKNIIARLPYLRPSTEIRQGMQYNNIHYFILAEIITQLTHGSFAEYAQTHILDAIGMSSSTFHHALARGRGHAANAFVRAELNSTKCRDVWREQDKLDRSCYGRPFETSWYTKDDGLYVAGPVGLASSANDLVRWLKELLEPAVIPKHIIDETHKIVVAEGDSSYSDEIGAAGYGYGQATFHYRGHEIISHYGRVPGFGSQVARLPNLGIGLFIGFNDNIMGSRVGDAIFYTIIDRILELEPIDWEERLVTREFRNEQAYTPVPDDSRPPPPMSSLVGQYHDKGYGQLYIMTFEHEAPADRSTPNPFPQAFLDEIHRAASTEIGLSAPLLFTCVDTLFTAVHVYSHFDGPIFNVTVLNVKQNTRGDFTAYRDGTSSAVFVEDKGLGMFGNFWEGIKGRIAAEIDVKLNAEVWYDKVKDVEQTSEATYATRSHKINTADTSQVEFSSPSADRGGQAVDAALGRQADKQMAVVADRSRSDIQQHTAYYDWVSAALLFRSQALSLSGKLWLGTKGKRAGDRE